MRTAAVLPVKSFGRAKQRLDAAVQQPARAGLAAAMVGDVLAALGRVEALDDVIVVTAEPRAAAALLVPGDCPSLDAGEVAALLRGEGSVVIVPDRHGTGTNALLLTPPE